MEIESLYSYCNDMAAYVMSDAAVFEKYLLATRNLAHYTPANNLLIAGYTNLSNPVYLKDYRDWEAEGRPDGDRAVQLFIMKHLDDGSYEPRPMIAVTGEPEVYYDKVSLVESLMRSAPCKIEADPESRHRALYIPDSDTIKVNSGFKSVEHVFFTLSKEYAHCIMCGKFKEMHKNEGIKLKYPRSQNEFTAYAAAYAHCARYGMIPENTGIRNLPEGWKSLDTKEIRAELAGIKVVSEALEKRMPERFSSALKNENNLNMEASV